MRRHVVGKFAAGAVLAACACAGIMLAQGGLASLGVSEATGREIVDGWLDSGFINASPAAKALKPALPASRATMVRNAVAWARAYTESPAFKAEYARRRQAALPSPPEAKGTVDDELARQRADRQKDIDEMKKNLAQLPPDVRKAMESAIKEAEAANRKMEADPQMAAMLRQGAEAQRADEQEAYKKRLDAYERRWPADPKSLVARRLQEFLAVSADVDFDAKLVPAGRLMRFADPRYEEKPPTWKLCFRVGREATAATREAVQAWLKAIG
jgi:hypothetical protein